MGGLSDVVMQRAARLAGGWQPTIAPAEASEAAGRFRERVEAAGRDPGEVGLENLIHCGTTIGGPIQSPEEAAQTARIFRKAGYSHVCISTMDSAHAGIEDHLEFATTWLRMAR